MAGRIRIGNQTAVSALSLTGPFEFAVENGFSAFEWFPDNWDEQDVGAETRRHIRETAKARGIALSVHAPWWANPLEPGSEGQFTRSIEFARDIGAVLLNIHLFNEQGVEAYARAIAPVIRAAGGAGLRLAIENTPITPPEDFNRLFEELSQRDAGAEHVGMCLDLGHANLCAATLNDYIGYVDRLSPQVPIIHVHLHENYGDQDSHLTLFTGPSGRDPSGIEAFLERLVGRGFSGSIILEQWPEDPARLVSVRDRLLEMLGSHGPHLTAPAPGSPEADVTAESRQGEEERGHGPHLTSPVAMEERAGPEAQPAGADFASALASEDAARPSWRLKLEAVDGLLPGRPGLEELVHVSVYLKLIATGAVACAEDGRHFRPSHHARAARRIERKLARASRGASEAALPEYALVLRRIYPYLPSYGGEFLRAEPLTRIRDIAHRGDIPKELKREIKHTLQNKLHRCAGPEDLETSRALLERITAPGADYSPDFVREFRVFHTQLREFFNAEGLDERLKRLSETDLPPKTAALIRKFLKARGSGSRQQAARVLRDLTSLREALRPLLSQKGDEDFGQQARLSDTGLEDFAFTLLGGFINSLDFKDPGKAPWPLAADILGLSAGNMALSGGEPEECRAVQAELDAVSDSLDMRDRESILRAMAAVERSRRLSEAYTEKLLSLYVGRVGRLGRLLGVEEHVISNFAEGEARGSLAFQVSRLSSALLSALRKAAGLSPWDALVAGRAEGRLVRTGSLGEVKAREENVIALLGRATGYEEVPLGVAGVILSHEIPHLSHLLVRARQEGVVFAATEDAEEIRRLEGLAGEIVVLEAAPGGVRVRRSTGGSPASSPEKTPEGAVRVPEADLRFIRRLITLDEVRACNAGGKAEALRRLAGLAALEPERAGYETLPALVVPFGVMEEALRESGSEGDYRRRLGEIEGSADSLARLRELIRSLPVHEEITRGAAEGFSRGDRLAVRSSANLEDLPGLSGAGLYDTVINVPPSGAAEAVRAVWASLFTGRAVAARRRFGIPQESALMAVVLQKMLSPDYSFILFSANPVSGDREEAYMELAPGLGETLASGSEPGTPYRISVNKTSGAARTLAFASFSHAARPGREAGKMGKRVVDYSREMLTADRGLREALAARLARVAVFLEESLGGPQDAEGAVAGDAIYVFQSRPLGL